MLFHRFKRRLICGIYLACPSSDVRFCQSLDFVNGDDFPDFLSEVLLKRVTERPVFLEQKLRCNLSIIILISSKGTQRFLFKERLRCLGSKKALHLL